MVNSKQALDTHDPKGIRWNEVTWYSRILSIIFLIGVVPAIAFYLGIQYENTQQMSYSLAVSPQPIVVRPASPNVTSLGNNQEGLPSSFSAGKYTNPEYGESGFSLEYPAGITLTAYSPSRPKIFQDLGPGHVLTECKDSFSTCLRIEEYDADYKKVVSVIGTSNLTQELAQEPKEISVGVMTGLTFSSFFSNMGETCMGNGVAIPLEPHTLVLRLSRCSIDRSALGDSSSVEIPPGNRPYNDVDTKMFNKIVSSIVWGEGKVMGTHQ